MYNIYNYEDYCQGCIKNVHPCTNINFLKFPTFQDNMSSFKTLWLQINDLEGWTCLMQSRQ